MTIQDPMFPPPRIRAEEPADAPSTAPGILAHPSIDRILESATRAADGLAKLNAAMDRLMIATGDGIVPAVRELADQLITFLDTAAGWDECEQDGDEQDDDGDLNEATLGAPEAMMNQESAWRDDSQEGEDREGDELDTLEASDLEISGESDCDGRSGTVDDEPSLGSLDRRMSQLRWGSVDRRVDWSDLEYDDADNEIADEDLPHDEEV